MIRSFSCFVFTVLLSINLYAAQVTFSAGGNSPLTPGPAPVGVSVADFNGDGKQDLFVVNNNSNASLSLGVGDGTFAAATTVPVGEAVRFAAIGDFNGDGRPDAVVCKPAALKIGVLLNNGTGGFEAIKDITTNDTPYSVITADFNNDGKLDLAVASNGLGACVYLGKGDGTFNPRNVYAAGGNVIDIAAGKLNDDNILDLAVVNMGDGTVSILIGADDGSFAAPVDFDAGDQPYGIAVGDLNNDTIADIAVTNLNSRAVTLLFGDGAGGFGSSDVLTTDGDTPISGVIADFNGNGFNDLIVLNANGQSFQIYLGGNSGLVSDGVIATPVGTLQIATGDFNADKRPDVVTANFSSDSVSVFLNTFTISQTVSFPPIADRDFGSAPFNVAATASSGKPVTITILSGPATITGNTITLTSSGTVVVRASQPGEGFLSEAHVDRSFVVSRGTPVIVWPSPAPIIAGQALTAVQLNASSNVAGTFSYDPPSGTRFLTGQSQTLSVSFTPTNSDQYKSVSASVSISILAPASPPGGGSDSDGDGFSDAMEIAAGSSPSSFNDRPYGLETGLPLLDITDVDLGISLNFAHGGKDRIAVSGTIAATFPESDATPFAIEVGGVAKSFMLDKKGQSKSSRNSLRIANARNKDACSFSLKLNQGSFAISLKELGLTDTTTKNFEVTVPVTVLFAGKVFATSVKATYKAKQGRSGSAKN